MIKINKNLADIPESLAISMDNNTHLARLDVISNGAYYKEETYNQLYKKNDIKEKLNSYYHQKCAYCEQMVEQIHVEHYRPKKEKGSGSYAYFWLAFSWDNLLLACPNCNSNKGSKFKIKGLRASFTNNTTNLRDINILSAYYDQNEMPLMVNPEVSDPKGLIEFSQDGKIWSDDERYTYTIDECKINRKALNDQRRKVINDLKEDLRAELCLCSTYVEQCSAIKQVIRKFKRDASNKLNTFLAFRNYAIKENWIKYIILEIIK